MTYLSSSTVSVICTVFTSNILSPPYSAWTKRWHIYITRNSGDFRSHHIIGNISAPLFDDIVFKPV
jgi:hypothetical protein